MRLVIVTSDDDAFGGVFARAYHAAGGIAPAAVVVLPGRPELGFRGLAQAEAALRLFGVLGCLRVAAARYARRPLAARDRDAGLAHDWLPSLVGPDTRLVHLARPNAPEGVAALRELAPDLLVSVGAPVILKPDVLAIPRLGALNVHNGRLPAYRGHFGTFWEVLRGEPWSYSTVHVMTATVDQGAVLAEDRVAPRAVGGFLDLMIEKKARAGALLARVVAQAAALGRLPAPVAAARDDRAGYFGWPSLADVRRFRWPPRGAALAHSPSTP